MSDSPDDSGGARGGELLDAGLRLLRSRLPSASGVEIVKELAGGYTDARVMLCDIARATGPSSEGTLDGQYVLKVSYSTDHRQAAAHEAFVAGLEHFGRRHVPRLMQSLESAGTVVDVYDIAGRSLDRVRSADHVDAADRLEVFAQAARDLLAAQLAVSGPPDYQGTFGGVLREWLGHDFPDGRRGTLVRETLTALGATGNVFGWEGEVLPNPLALLDPEGGLAGESLGCFRGPSHGDLHMRNILVSGSRLTRDLDYWLIDINWDRSAPLLYDHAYLELSALLFGLEGSPSGRVLPLLAELDQEILAVPAPLDLNDHGLATLLRRIRSETVEVLEQCEANRMSVWRRQLLVARIAAGLNWATKPLSDMRLRCAALVSSAWAARLLLRESFPLLWLGLTADDQRTSVGAVGDASATPVTAAEALRRWLPFHQVGGGIDLFLVADRVDARPELAALANCGWATVIDLDPDSDVDGLSSVVVPKLEALRHVSVFGSIRQPVPPTTATSWLMANGWNSRGEASTDSSDQWRRRRYLQQVRQLVDETHEGTPHQSAAVLRLSSGQRDRELDWAIDYIDERYEGVALRLDLAQAPAVDGFDLSAFLGFVAESLPPVGDRPVPSLPGLDGRRWELNWSDLHRLSVDLEVLHSEVLSGGQSSTSPTDDFWRGRPPTWQELEAGVDVQREALPGLLQDIRERISDHQLATVHLDHSPGAGGTTLARRVAWELHRTYPTVLLRNYSPATSDRIDEIFQETGLPALVIAESAVLPDYDCDEFVHALAQRNARAVVLWVNRTNIGNRRSHRKPHRLIDPIRGAERDRFFREFKRRADTDRARKLLADLSAGATDVAVQRLSPFYFGLCVYEQRFEGIETYVRNHLVELNRKQRELARHLALITRYGQERGLPIDMVESWMGRTAPRFANLNEEELKELLGPDLRHLVVVKGNSLRLLHPLVAEHVLTESVDGTFLSLARMSVDFIKKTVEYLGPDNVTTERLFTELFIRRTSWSPSGAKQDNFSELIEAMEPEGGALVFEQLTVHCPNNPHFWNHRGRYDIYKVKADFRRAEGYVLKAVEKAVGHEGTHLHTLGLVRRFWIESKLDEMARGGGKPTPEELLSSIKPLFDSAMEAFTEAGKFQQTDYTWSTPIQLIATVVERLWMASGEESLAEFMEAGDASSVWVAEQIGLAEELLQNLRNLNAEGTYYQRLDNRLTELYGDIELLVDRWRELRGRGEGSPEVDLAIARTLFAKAGRDWSRLSEDEVRDVAAMTEGSVDSGRATDADLRLWFQAYRRLPEYSETKALERFKWFAVERNSLDAHYYLYILNFLIWYRGDARDEERVRFYLEECKRLSRQHRRQWSFEWLGVSSRAHPLVHFSELGRQRHGPTGFWSRPQELLRVKGVIEEIKSPQSGRLRLAGGRLPAFFTPRNRFRQTRDVNNTVEFYLGFSYEGLRAWEPTYPGEVPEALTNAERVDGPPTGNAKRAAGLDHSLAEHLDPPEAPAVGAVEPSEPRELQPQVVAQVEHARAQRQYRADPEVMRALAGRMKERNNPDAVKGVILDLVQRAHANERQLTSLELGEALQAFLGLTGYTRFRDAKGGLQHAVEALGFRTTSTLQGFDVGLH